MFLLKPLDVLGGQPRDKTVLSQSFNWVIPAAVKLEVGEQEEELLEVRQGPGDYSRPREGWARL